MRKIKVVLVMLVLLFIAAPAFAADSATPAGNHIGTWFLAGFGLALAVAGAAYAQSKVASAACEGLARNPAARPGIQLALILGLAFIESLVLFVWLMVYLNRAA